MEISLRLASAQDAKRLNEMQVRSFLPVSEKYDDHEGSPAYETIDRTLERITSPHSACHIILADGCYAGMICVRCIAGGTYKVSPAFVLPEYQNCGIGQESFRLLDALYPDAAVWTLSTISEEERNLHFYEKLGYRKIGFERKINEKMTIICYERRIQK